MKSSHALPLAATPASTDRPVRSSASTATATPAAAAAVSPRVLRAEAVVDAPAAEVWRAWSTSSGASAFLAPRVNIDLRIGGVFEVFFDPQDASKSSRGIVLALVPGQMISFGWHLPPLYPQLPHGVMPVLIALRPTGPARTVVAIAHFGWGAAPCWDEPYTHMLRGWSDVLGRLQHRFAVGPIDWAAEMASGPDRREFTLKERAVTPV